VIMVLAVLLVVCGHLAHAWLPFCSADSSTQ
jgi:hypothetical protein